MRDMARMLVEQRLMSAQEAEPRRADVPRAPPRRSRVTGFREMGKSRLAVYSPCKRSRFASNGACPHSPQSIGGSPVCCPTACPIRAEMILESKTALFNHWRGHMGIWTTKFRKPALIAGALAISLAANPAFAKRIRQRLEARRSRFHQRRAHRRRGRGSARRHRGRFASARIMGERSHKKSEALAARKAEGERCSRRIRNAQSRR